MAIGFVDLTSTNRTPDKGMSRTASPRLYRAAFGDGYEQRIVSGINPLEETYGVSFNNRARAEIDDIVAFFENKKGVTNFSFTYPDTNSAGNEATIRVVCENWSTSYTDTSGASCSAKFRRVYEP